jgi:hypothetical protein
MKYGSRSGFLLAATTIPLLLVAVGGPALSIYQNSLRVTATSFIGTTQTFGGSSATLNREDWYPDRVDAEQVTPPFEVVRDSVPPVYRDLSFLGSACHVGRESRDQVAWCEYGQTTNPSYTIALVGASHSAHWLPPLQVIAERNSWRVITLTASDCNFRVPHPTRFPFHGCDEVADQMREGIVLMKPDLVITIANSTEGTEPEPERISMWRELDEFGIPIVAIRDNPEFPIEPSRCVSQNLSSPLTCATERNNVLASFFDMGDSPANVSLVDMSDQYCDDILCPAVIGNLLLWRDSDHFTVEFALTMADVLEERVRGVWQPQGPSTVQEFELRKLIPRD